MAPTITVRKRGKKIMMEIAVSRLKQGHKQLPQEHQRSTLTWWLNTKDKFALKISLSDYTRKIYARCGF